MPLRKFYKGFRVLRAFNKPRFILLQVEDVRGERDWIRVGKKDYQENVEYIYTESEEK